MNQMSLPFKHRILNSIPGGLRPSTLPLGHGHLKKKLRVSGEETFASLKSECQNGVRGRNLSF